MEHSVIARGCTVEGEAENSVLSERCTEEAGASVQYSILMPGAAVRRGARVSYPIIGENGVVGERALVGEPPEAVAPENWGITCLLYTSRGFAGLERFTALRRVEPALKDAPDAKELTNCRGELDVDHVSFSYEGTEGEGVLHDVSVHVTPGEMLAIVGPSGGGKSTLCQLIPRFYEVSGGRCV